MDTHIEILIVDDDGEDRQMMFEYFKEAGVEQKVHLLENGLIALQYLEKIKDDRFLPRLIVFDLNMPILNGTQSLLRIKQTPRLRDIPVVIFSTSSNEIEKQRCLSYGAREYIVKPFTYAEGRAMVEKFTTFISISAQDPDVAGGITHSSTTSPGFSSLPSPRGS